jgi:hypothetical protein
MKHHVEREDTLMGVHYEETTARPPSGGWLWPAPGALQVAAGGDPVGGAGTTADDGGDVCETWATSFLEIDLGRDHHSRGSSALITMATMPATTVRNP